MLTDDQLAAIAARAEAATPGLYRAIGMAVYTSYTWPMTRVTDVFLTRYDAEFFAHARQDVPALLVEVDALRRQLAHMTQWRDSAIVDGNEARAEAAALRRQLAECQADRSEVLRAIDIVIAERDAAHVALDAAQATMRNMRRDEYRHVREEFPPGRTLIVSPDVSGSTMAAQVADAEDYPPPE